MHHKTYQHPLKTLILLGLLGCTAISQNTLAWQFVVTKTTDSSDGSCDTDCSLREAIDAASKYSGGNVIFLKAETYELTLPAQLDEEGEIIDEDNNKNGDLDLKTHVTIKGAEGGRTIINANKLDRHFTIFEKGGLTLKHVELINGKSSTSGGSILNFNIAHIENSKLTNNIATSGWHRGNGGAIANYHTLYVQRSELNNNIASFGDTSYSFGGAIYNKGFTIIRDSAFRHNRAHTDDVISYGGAIYNESEADIGRSIFVGNSAQGGGMAIYNTGKITISNATISGNSGDYYQVTGALHNTGTLSLVNTSIINNWVGAGFYNTGTSNIRNSIILHNLSDYPDEEYPPAPINCYNSSPASQFKARGLLLGEGNTKCAGEIYVADSDTFTHVLAPLAQNNYHLETHALLPNSPAIDAGIGSCSSHDQRWLPRPADGNADGVANCDLGAFELQPSP